jgi:hypothetical protein
MEDDMEDENNPLAMGVSGAGDTLTSLSQRYSGVLGQQEAARRDAAAQRAAQFKSAQDSIRQQRFGAPTTSEQLYALSSALLSPRSQPGFAGTMSNLMPALMQTSQMRRGAEEQREVALQQLQQQYATAEEKAMAEGLETQRKGLEPLLRAYGPLAKPQRPRVQLSPTTDLPVNLETGRPIVTPAPQVLDALDAYLSDPNNPPELKQKARRDFTRRYGAPLEQFLGD